jgi:hypothetical protein
MKTFTNMAAQGDFIILRVKNFPKNLVEIAPQNNKFVVAHSETGHDHVMVLERLEQVTAYKDKDTKDVDLYKMFFDVKESVEIEHHRSHDTHETLEVPKGKYMIARQREHVPEGFRRAQD